MRGVAGAWSNIPPGTVHRILGHASFATTMKLYGDLTSEALIPTT
jgi:hypothetical protein